MLSLIQAKLHRLIETSIENCQRIMIESIYNHLEQLLTKKTSKGKPIKKQDLILRKINIKI